MVLQVLMIDLGCTGEQNCTCTDCDCVDRPGSQCMPQSIGATEIHPPDDWGDWMLPLAYNNGAKVFLAPFGDTGALLHLTHHSHCSTINSHLVGCGVC